jgi:hypothetical protein
MSVLNDSTSTGTIDDGRALLSSTFLEFCAKVRNDDTSVLPEPGRPFKIRHLSEKEDIELADALLENTSVTYLELETEKCTKSSAEAMAKYVRTSKRLQHIRWNPGARMMDDRGLCCFLPAIQESTSLKELHMELPLQGGPSNLAFENMLTHTQSLRSSESCLSSWPTRRQSYGCSLVWIEKEHHSTRAHTGISAECNNCLSHFHQSVRASSPSKAMFAWECGGSDWTRDCVAKRHLQNHGT